MKKFVTVLCDGMADYPDANGRTPMTEAKKPTMDRLCRSATVGLVRTVEQGMKPGSDVCNLAALGYDPRECYTGRSPLEALSMGIAMGAHDVSYRVNLVTLASGDTLDAREMLDYSAGEISTAEAAEIIKALQPLFAEYGIELYAGISYRHAAIIRNGASGNVELTPPHDILGKRIGEYLPRGKASAVFNEIIAKSVEALAAHPINAKRKADGRNPVTAVWFWGEGTKPRLDGFYEKYGKRGAMISAVDLLKGIGVASGMDVIDIPTATGTVDTDYEAKAAAAIAALDTHDFVFVHLEGPDECGHQGDRAGKITAIERIDARILKPVLDALERGGKPFAVTVMPDHATPLAVRTHTADPIPFLIFDSEHKHDGAPTFDEHAAKSTGVTLDRGAYVIETMFGIKGGK